MGWPVLALCFEACWFGELSQQPICPHAAHLRRCSHHPPVAKQSTQPVPVGFAVGLMPSLKLHGLSCLISTQTDCCIYVCGISIRHDFRPNSITMCIYICFSCFRTCTVLSLLHVCYHPTFVCPCNFWMTNCYYCNLFWIKVTFTSE